MARCAATGKSFKSSNEASGAPIGTSSKVIWGSGWDPLLARDTAGHLAKRMEEALDGDYQMYSVSPGALQREHWVEQTPALEGAMDSLSDEEISTIKRGGQDVKKLYAGLCGSCRLRGVSW